MKRPYFQDVFSLDEFRQRRHRVGEQIGSGIAVIAGSPATGAMDRFRQHNDFFYLCGVEVPHAYLTIEGGNGRSTLFLPPRNDHAAEVDGPELNADDADNTLEMTGVDRVRPLDALADAIRDAGTIHVCSRPPESRQACQDSIRDARRRANEDPWRTDPYAKTGVSESLLRHAGPLDVKDLSPLLVAHRRLKSAAEIHILRRAGQITAMATAEAMRCTRPGLIEGQLAGVADYVYLVNGAMGGAYRPIVASGDNIWNSHYFRNDCPLREEELVLFDYAPDLCYYTSDIGRMWPVNGNYLRWQRELYGFVVDYHLALLELIEPGKTPKQIREQAADRFRSIVSRTNWSRPQFRDAIDTLLATSRSLTHSVGMAVHDESGCQEDDVELQPGLVFALDPQLWVPDDRLYFRVEDNVVVTNEGVENFTGSVAHAPEDIETLMQEEGILQSRPDLLETRTGEIQR